MKIYTFLLLILLSQLFAKEQAFLGGVPPVPESGIYDPENWLTDDAYEEITQNIFRVKTERDVEVFVIISREDFELDRDLIAAKAAMKWGSGDLWGVAIHVLGDPDSPQFFVGRKPSFGWNEEQERSFSKDLRQALNDAKGRAARETDARQKVQIGVRELCDELSWVGLVMKNTNRHYERARGESIQQFQASKVKRGFLRKLLLFLIPLVFLLGGLLFFIFRKKSQGLRSDFLFPETSPRYRFQGPWSGGGDVVVKVGSRMKEDGSRIG